MKAVSNVVAAMILIGITLVGFAVAYPILFSRLHGAYGGVSTILGLEARGKSVKLSMIDYGIEDTGDGYRVKLVIYNAGWARARIVKALTPDGYSTSVDVDIPPKTAKQLVVDIPGEQGAPDKIILYTESGRVFVFILR